MTKKYLRILMLAGAATFGVIIAVTTWRFFERGSSVITLMLVSLFVAIAFEPAVNKMTKSGKMRRGIAAGLLLGGTVLLISIFCVLAGTLVATQVRELWDSLPHIVTSAQQSINNRFGTNINFGDVQAKLRNFDSGTAALTAAGKAVPILLNMLSILLISFYLIVDGPAMRRRVCSLLAPKHQAEILRGWDLAVEKTGGYIYSRVILAIISTIFHMAVFLIIGVPYAVLFALWVGIISQLIPVIGTYLAVGLPLLVILVSGNITSAVVVLIVVTVYQQIENTVIAPKLTKQVMALHPLITFISVLFAAVALGPAYTLLAIPMVAIVQGFVSSYIKTHELIDDPRLGETIPVAASDSKIRKRFWRF
jgi:predicted PurR-regulated permease PerM